MMPGEQCQGTLNTVEFNHWVAKAVVGNLFDQVHLASLLSLQEVEGRLTIFIQAEEIVQRGMRVVG